MIHVAEKAHLQGEKDSYVYVQAAENRYVRRPVEVEIVKEGLSIIASGLQEGERVISEGDFYHCFSLFFNILSR